MPQGQKNQNINRHNIATDSIKTKIMRADFCRSKVLEETRGVEFQSTDGASHFYNKMKLTDKGRKLVYLMVERRSNVPLLVF